MTRTDSHLRPRLARALAALLVAALLPATRTLAADCRVATSDFCVCCPPSDCRKEEAFCPGGTAGLLLLETRNPACVVNPWAAERCVSGGIVASERTSALGVFVQGQRARVDMTRAQLDGLVEQLEALGR